MDPLPPIVSIRWEIAIRYAARLVILSRGLAYVHGYTKDALVSVCLPSYFLDLAIQFVNEVLISTRQLITY